MYLIHNDDEQIYCCTIVASTTDRHSFHDQRGLLRAPQPEEGQTGGKNYRNSYSLISVTILLQRMREGVERDLQRQRKKAENLRLLEEQLTLQQKLQERDKKTNERIKHQFLSPR